MPFNGGKRVCFGKTFAENVLRMIATMLAQSFDFELVNSDKYDANNLPMLMGGQSHFPKNPLKLTKYVPSK
jgi:cytochrome P450